MQTVINPRYHYTYHPVRLRVFPWLRARSVRSFSEPVPGVFGAFLLQGYAVFAEQHLPEEAEAELHQRGIIGEYPFGFICGQIIELGKSLAGHETAEGVDVVANHEEQLQAAFGGFADAGAGGFFLEDELPPAGWSDWITVSPENLNNGYF